MLRVTAAVVAMLAFVPVAAADVNADRARASLAALDQAFRTSGATYRDPGEAHAVYAWPFSQEVAASIAVAAMPEATRADRRRAATDVAALARYRSGRVYGATPGGPVFVDDNEWIAFDLLDWSVLAHDASAAANARGIFGLAVARWDGAAADPCTGGVYWTLRGPNHDRNAVTTGGGALLGLRLAALRGNDPAVRWWSRRMLDWLDSCLLEPDGFYSDHIDASGRLEPRAWSYNQGLVIGADVLAAQAGDPTALPRAESLAQASLYFLDPSRLWAEPAEFDAVLARNLLLLGRVDGDQQWRAAVQAYADTAWASTRDPATGLFDLDGTGPRLIEQAALTQVYALLAAG